ncbi:heat shock transcription factor, Y-linked-like [Neopsephotus bourkii]|nr:heat shock transcription factor, Y-linked-like [Neopsephotus bourkii]
MVQNWQPGDMGEHPLVPTVSQRQQPLLADCRDWAWFSRAVAAERTVGPGPIADMEWEPAPAPAPSLSAPDELEQSADTTAAGPSGQGETAPCDTAGAAMQEERDVQPASQGHDPIRIPPLSKRSRGRASEFSGLCFPQRLWKILESSKFRSIWWGMAGKCVAINEELFQKEVLGRVFSTHKMKSFTRQLNNYGFNKVHPDTQRSASLPEFLAEEAAASSHSKLLYYYNPSFSRERPQLLQQRKGKAAVKRKAPGAAQEEEEHPSRRADAQPAVHKQASPPAKRRLKHFLAPALPIHLQGQLLPQAQCLPEQQAARASPLPTSASHHHDRVHRY